MKNKFKKGQKVTLQVNVMGVLSYEDAIISKINKQGVWLDNGDGNDESGPFNPITGERQVFMGSQKITSVGNAQ